MSWVGADGSLWRTYSSETSNTRVNLEPNRTTEGITFAVCLMSAPTDYDVDELCE